MTNFVENCRFCGNEIDYDNSCKHQYCYEYYHFILEEIIEKMKMKLDVLLKLKKDVHLAEQ